jgi:hypothetical protein
MKKTIPAITAMTVFFIHIHRFRLLLVRRLPISCLSFILDYRVLDYLILDSERLRFVYLHQLAQ